MASVVGGSVTAIKTSEANVALIMHGALCRGPWGRACVMKPESNIAALGSAARISENMNTCKGILAVGFSPVFPVVTDLEGFSN